MSTREWARIREQIDRLKNKRRQASAVAWAAVGVIVSAVFAMIAWIPAYATMPANIRGDYLWVWFAIAVLGICGIAYAGAYFNAAKQLGDDVEVRVEDVLKLMDEIYPPAPEPLATAGTRVHDDPRGRVADKGLSERTGDTG